MSHEFEIVSWEESPYLEIDETAKFTRAVIHKKYIGELEGEGRLTYLMAYNPDGSATFVGIERITGSIKGKTGSFSTREQGTFVAGKVESSFTIIEASSTGELSCLIGQGYYITGHTPRVAFEFEYKC
jgi:hypothetical protein